MTDSRTEAREGRTDDGQRANRTDDPQRTDSTDGDSPEVGCTLTPEAEARRREWVEISLLPHLEDVEEREDGFTFVFERVPEAYAAVTEAAWKESQCCAWATFEVVLPPGEGKLEWRERSDREGASEFFGDALRDVLADHEDVTI